MLSKVLASYDASSSEDLSASSSSFTSSSSSSLSVKGVSFLFITCSYSRLLQSEWYRFPFSQSQKSLNPFKNPQVYFWVLIHNMGKSDTNPYFSFRARFTLVFNATLWLWYRFVLPLTMSTWVKTSKTLFQKSWFTVYGDTSLWNDSMLLKTLSELNRCNVSDYSMLTTSWMLYLLCSDLKDHQYAMNASLVNRCIQESLLDNLEKLLISHLRIAKARRVNHVDLTSKCFFTVHVRMKRCPECLTRLDFFCLGLTLCNY